MPSKVSDECMEPITGGFTAQMVVNVKRGSQGVLMSCFSLFSVDLITDPYTSRKDGLTYIEAETK